MSKYLAFQTGTDRMEYFKNQDTYKESNSMVHSENGENGQITKFFLKHSDEARLEGEDFLATFKDWLKVDKEGGDTLENLKFNVFLSIGSTSTQGWRIVVESGEFKVVPLIPLDEDTSGRFEICGVLKATKEQMRSDGCLKHQSAAPDSSESAGTLLNIHLKKHLNKNDRILCFNAIGYKLSPIMQRKINSVGDFMGIQLSEDNIKFLHASERNADPYRKMRNKERMKLEEDKNL